MSRLLPFDMTSLNILYILLVFSVLSKISLVMCVLVPYSSFSFSLTSYMFLRTTSLRRGISSVYHCKNNNKKRKTITVLNDHKRLRGVQSLYLKRFSMAFMVEK